MSAVLVAPELLLPRALPVVDGRPPGRGWVQPADRPPEQPTLLFEAPPVVVPGAPRVGAHRVRVVATSAPGGSPSGQPAPPADAEGWSASLAQALAEALQGRRPVGQLSRWTDEPVLALLQAAVGARRPRPRGGTARQRRPAVLRSLHLQRPHPGAVEVAAHLQLSTRSAALAFRLEARTGRWLCTALDLGPADQFACWAD